LQEIALSNTDCGSTIEEVEAHLKAHDAFQNLVAGQEEKVASLRDHADKLVRQKHFDAATIAAKLAEIQEKRSAVAELCTHKTNLLNLNYLYAKFMQVSFLAHALQMYTTILCLPVSPLMTLFTCLH
jgi:hypothetical protein